MALLAVFGLSFGTVLQSGYERIWDLPPAGWWARWRHVLWLSMPVVVLYMSAITPPWRDSPPRGFVTVVIGTMVFCWSQRLLLGGRVGWLALLPGAVATMIGLLGLRIFSRLVFSPLIVQRRHIRPVRNGPLHTDLARRRRSCGLGRRSRRPDRPR
ncbi:hypothetical protein ACIGO7_31555 [Streptomyces virginiae]|uniref:hypothetical protein n=1 Tax=Streptomyces virginiae TaxID=1961 RepID=UPI0037D15199